MSLARGTLGLAWAGTVLSHGFPAMSPTGYETNYNKNYPSVQTMFYCK